MIQPKKDKDAIKRILEEDPYISRLGIASEMIKTTSYSSEIFSAQNIDLQILIYNGPSERTRSWMQKGVVYRVLVAGKRSNQPVIDDVTSQVIALLAEKEIIPCHILELLDAPMELPNDPSLYMVETSFICYETVFNRIMK